jgi:ABC-2 type transport system permease protein
MNKNVILAVCKRDLRSWFSNPIGYVFILLFVAVSCLALMWPDAFFTNNLANLDTWNGLFPPIAILFVAASAMNMWAGERSNGTQELLFTLPARDFDLQLGKFLAGVGVFTMALVFTLPLPIALSWLGSPDWGLLFANYVGFWLFGVLLVSVSMIGSQVTQNAAVSFILSALFCLVVVYLGSVMSWLGSQAWISNGPLGQFAEFARGTLPLSGFVLFVGLSVAFFYLSLALLGRRNWRSEMEPLHATMRFAGGAVMALAVTVIGVYTLPRLDATIERIHTLSHESRELLARLDPSRPVTITAYVSEDVPESYVQQRRLLLNLVDQFDSLGGSAVQRRIVMPEPFSPEARAAEQNYGIRPRAVAERRAGGGYAEYQVFLGFVVRCGTDEITSPFVEPAVPLEYELMRSIRVVSNADRRKVGILKTDLELSGGFDMQTFRPKTRWQIAEELGHQYDLENVDPDGDYPEGIDCLIVPQPSSLVQEQMGRLQRWMLAGHPTLLLEDPLPIDPLAAGTAADEPKGGMQARMMGGGGPQKGNIAGLLSAIGVGMPAGEIVWDGSARLTPFRGLTDECLFVRGPGVSAGSAITNGLQSVVVMFAGHLMARKKEGVTVTPLLFSPNPASSRRQNGIVRKSELFVQDLFGARMNPNARRELRNDDLVVAARVRGKPDEGAAKGTDVIVVTDIDLISDQFFQIRRQYSDPNFSFDNVTFILNCVDTLVGDESLIELRKRRPVLRKLDRVEKSQAEFEQAWVKQKEAAEAASTEALAEAQKRLDDAVAKIRDDSALDAASKEQKIAEVENRENRRLELTKAQIEDQKEASIQVAAYERDAGRDAVANGYRLVTLVVAILPGLLLGLVTLFRRHSRATAIVPASRRVSNAQGTAGGAR